MTRSSTPPIGSPPSFSVGSPGRWVAPVLSVVGLLLVAFVTLSLLNGTVPFVGGPKGGGNGTGNGSGDGGPAQTAAPPNVVVVPPDVVTFKGSIAYAKAGNIWIQNGKDVKQLTTSGNDSMPSWSPDGTTIYFVRTVAGTGRWPSGGIVRDYNLTTPSVMRVKADGTGKVETVVSGKITANGRTWQAWIRQPVLSPDGRTLAMVSDRPNPSNQDVVLQFYDLTTRKSRVPPLAETAPLGHQDPVWRPDGKELLYVRNDRDGSKGTPSIYRWTVATSKGTPVTGPGYLEPSYSPDGKFVAATKTSSFGNDVVILDASNGRELLRVTTDGASWGPTWSPIGDAIAFLHISGQIVDLKQARLDGAAPDWTVKDITPLTEVSGLDGASRPDWFVPADQLPVPTQVPNTAPSSGPSSSPTTAP